MSKKKASPNIYYHFVVEGKVVPYVRMTQRSQYADPQAIRYLEWKDYFGWQVKKTMLENQWEMISGRVPLHLGIIYHLAEPRHPETKDGLATKEVYFDLSNVIKGVEDAAQGIVYENDREVDSISAGRYWDASKYQITLTVGGKNALAEL